MKQFFINDDLEGFLKESADGLRMRPSDKVWKGVSSGLNERRRRMGFATGGFLILTSVLGYFLMNDARNNVQQSTTAQAVVDVSLSNLISLINKRPSLSGSYTTPNIEADKITVNPTIESGISRQSAPAIIRPLYPPTPVDEATLTEENKVAALTEPFVGTIADDDYIPEVELPEADRNNLMSGKSEYPLTIESVTNIFKKFSKKKVSFQFFFTPTVSYRKLTENKSYLRNVPSTGTASYAELYNINDVVTHKPDIGLELGFAAKYPVAKSVQLRAGAQFNMNRYDIKAFNNPSELATIALNNGNNNVAMVGARSNYRNFGAVGKEDWLQNISFQVSAPVGAEIKVAGTSKGTSLGVATTIQPTYVLSDRAYLLSTDYKNYSEVSWLMRRFNVATSVETFVSYSTGKIKWQVGPQVRYQLLSSFVTEYPVKENLFDFGLKVGISLNDKKESETNK